MSYGEDAKKGWTGSVNEMGGRKVGEDMEKKMKGLEMNWNDGFKIEIIRAE